MLQLRLIRDTRYVSCTIGTLYAYIDGGELDRICYTLEDFCNETYNCQSPDEIKAVKVAGKTAIPFGAYHLTFEYSPKFKREMLTINNVPGFSGIRIHAGNNADQTDGCVLVGMAVHGTTITSSREALDDLEKIVKGLGNGEAILFIV